jgi:hypothetical protein
MQASMHEAQNPARFFHVKTSKDILLLQLNLRIDDITRFELALGQNIVEDGRISPSNPSFY